MEISITIKAEVNPGTVTDPAQIAESIKESLIATATGDGFAFGPEQFQVTDATGTVNQ